MDNRSNPSNEYKLHEAIELVLIACENKTADIEFIAEQIKQRELYRQKSGDFPFPKQIWLRAKNYPQFWIIDKETIQLK